jgi:hypothetical protein
VELFEKALKVSARQIRCTSVDGNKLAGGADTDDELRREILTAGTFIGLITPTSAKSAWVLFELGARWGANLHLVPVLAQGADTSLLGGPLGGINALRLTARHEVLQLVEDISKHLEWQLEPMPSFQAAVDAVLESANTKQPAAKSSEPLLQPELSSEEIRVLQCLARSGEDSTAEQIAEHLKISEQKARYLLGLLEAKSMATEMVVFYGVTTDCITQEGRSALVVRDLL